MGVGVSGSKILRFYAKVFCCGGQGAVRQAVLYRVATVREIYLENEIFSRSGKNCCCIVVLHPR